MSALYLVEDARARDFEPFSLSRPAGELRAGAEIIRARWERILGIPCSGHVVSSHLAAFRDSNCPAALSDEVIPAGSVLINSRCAPALDETPTGDVWYCNGRVAAVRLGEAADPKALAACDGEIGAFAPKGVKPEPIRGWWVDEVWDLLRHLAEMLADDIKCLTPEVRRSDVAGLTRIGSHDLVIEPGATVEPYVVFDATDGPIMVRSGSTIRSFTRLVGPCFVGAYSQVGSGRVAVCSIGEVCRAHGELSNTIFISHANKSHDGFVGHSIVGKWVNLGAGTITSNLKNTYGSIQVWTPEGMRDSGLHFLGTLFGDHVKTGIGTRLTTGSVVGMGANIVCNGPAPKVVQPFCWGDPAGDKVYELSRFLEVAGRAMARRGVELSPEEKVHIERAYRARWTAT